MGLDMYAFATREKPSQDVDFAAPPSTELHYWRKHPNLHGWMQGLYYGKGGSADSFNCVNLLLSSDDLAALEEAIRADALPETIGFFFGMSDGSEKDDDLAFVVKARQAIAAGSHVYYTSWW